MLLQVVLDTLGGWTGRTLLHPNSKRYCRVFTEYNRRGVNNPQACVESTDKVNDEIENIPETERSVVSVFPDILQKDVSTVCAESIVEPPSVFHIDSVPDVGLID